MTESDLTLNKSFANDIKKNNKNNRDVFFVKKKVHERVNHLQIDGKFEMISFFQNIRVSTE